MKVIKIVFNFILYVCVYLLFLGLTALTLPRTTNAGAAAFASTFILLLLPLLFPFVIWRVRKHLSGKSAQTNGFLEKVEVYLPLINFFNGYLFAYIAISFLIGFWPEIRKEYPWTLCFLWQGFSIFSGFCLAKFASPEYKTNEQKLAFPLKKRKESKRAQNLKAIHRLSSLASHSDHPLELMDVTLPYPDKLEPGDTSPLYKSILKRLMELKEIFPEPVQKQFRDFLGIVCAPDEKFVFVYRAVKISVFEIQNNSSAHSIGVGIPGPLGIGIGGASSNFSTHEMLGVSNYGAGFVALSTNNLYFQSNGIWQKIDRGDVVSSETPYGKCLITISAPSGKSRQVQIDFLDYEVSQMLDALLRSQG